MERKPILMPPSLIRHGEALAKQSQISFAELVRRALRAYDPTRDEEEMLDAMAEAMHSSVKEARAAIRAARKEVKKTRQALGKEKRNGRSR
ncbi:MAG: hypothetical protein ACR2RB_20365 [Gammaproteobacteria bacterium]